MRRVAFAAFAAIGLVVATWDAGFCQDIASIRSMLAAKLCPPNEYDRITYDSRNCGDDAFRSCNQQYAMKDPGWRSCFTELHDCRKQIDDDNQVIEEANRVTRACQPRQRNEGYAARPDPRGNGSASSQSDLARRLADQNRNNASADAVRRQQDEQFDNTVRATQQRYQEYQSQQEANRQAYAREQEQRRDRERRAREQTQSRQNTSGGWNCFSDYSQCLSSCRAAKGWDDNGICGGRCSDGGIGNDPTPPGMGNCWK